MRVLLLILLSLKGMSFLQCTLKFLESYMYWLYAHWNDLDPLALVVYRMLPTKHSSDRSHKCTDWYVCMAAADLASSQCEVEIPAADRRDCYPWPGASQQLCATRGCVWCDDSPGSPSCYYNDKVSRLLSHCSTQISTCGFRFFSVPSPFSILGNLT